ncbi:TonB-dependent receptor [Qipengyuania qiaonensis]|uniref:TonB-dependent receptor n=1 Tax=Qipengyuania qiaonensis TaxID=2867240 RepID=A0ABS7JBN4_9SPHN|nr:TonB-dependent receptor [Qipengyuania qiaonensis]MBX7483469.1 TonB-dependent receptor [Qipengyuania qiaonensis]
MRKATISSRAILVSGAALLGMAMPAVASAQVTGDDDVEENSLDERSGVIIVTAQKRTQALSEVPQSISVVGGDTLDRQQADSFTDYVELVPSLSLTQSTPGETRVILRGVNTGSVGSTVAIYVDDTPFGSSSSLGNAAVLAGDFDTFDLERVEVLRGPQGTLYGSNALGGVIRFVTAAPKLGEFETSVQAGIDTVDAGGTGYHANGVLNVPLGKNLAVRASGFYRKRAGFVDAIGRTPEKEIDEAEIYGGRVSALFEPTPDFSVRLTALAQNIRAGSPSSFDADPVTAEPIDIDPNTGNPVDGLVRTEFYAENNDVDYRLYNGTLEYDFGPVSLTSVTSFGQLDQRQRSDNTIGFGPTVTFVYQTFGGRTDDVGVFLDAPLKQEKFTQELRLSSADGPFEWQIGGYYTDETVNIEQSLIPFVQDTGALFDPTVLGFADLLVLNLDSRYEEIAAFANVNIELKPRWELGGGIRYSKNDQSVIQTERGAFQPLQGLPSPNINEGKSNEDVVTWSVDTRYELSDFSSVYARVAKGYRPGGPNVVPPGAAADFPIQYDADTLVSYEIGFRAETVDRGFALDGAVYYLDWNDILIFGAFDSAIGPVGANDNGGGARVYGAELTATVRPVDGLTVMFNGAYNDAKLTDDTPPVTGGLDGDQLPYTPELTATMSVDYEWNIGGSALAFVGGDVRLVSDQAGAFDQTYRTLFGRRLEIDGYQKVDLRAGVAFDNFSITAFANNLTNSQGLTSFGDLGNRPGTLLAASPIRPRTFGLTAAASF